MKQLDANTLVAYVDGELDQETAELVEQQLADDPKAVKTVRELSDCAAIVRAAHNHVIHETVPGRLIDTILEAPETANYAGGSAEDTAGDSRLVEMILNTPETAESTAPEKAKRPNSVISLARRRSIAAVAMAATFAALMLGGGYYVRDSQLSGAEQMAAQQIRAIAAVDDPIREAAFQEALETKRSLREYVSWSSPLSGRSGRIVPVKSYRREDGSFCREYRLEESHMLPNSPNFGVACRSENGTWVKQFQVIAGP